QQYRGRIAIFHYAGHGSPFQILLEGGANGEPAYAKAFAEFLSTLSPQFSLKLVFLNACSTQKQVDALLNQAGVDVVIATSQRIRDDVARLFAEEFYNVLTQDLPVRTAFNQAASRVKMKFGESYQSLIRPNFFPPVGCDEARHSARQRALVW